MMGIIYCAENMQTHKRYIGKTRISLEKRQWDHLAQSKRGRQGYFYRAIRKYGIASFTWKILAQETDENLDETEKYWIKNLETTNPQYGYNIREGGQGGKILSEESLLKMRENNRKRNPFRGRQHTQETKEMMRIAALRRWSDPAYRKSRAIGQIGRRLSQKTKDKIRLAAIGRTSPMLGRHLSESAKQTIREARLGKHHAPESIEKIRAAMKGENNPMFGRRWHHSEESRKKISEALLRRNN